MAAPAAWGEGIEPREETRVRDGVIAYKLLAECDHCTLQARCRYKLYFLAYLGTGQRVIPSEELELWPPVHRDAAAWR